MRIAYLYGDWEKVFERDAAQVVIGRPWPGVAGPDLDLSPDHTVSRPHARLWIEAGQPWIEDLGSLHGTQVNAEEIKGRGPRQLHPGDRVRIGETLLWIEIPAAPAPESTLPSTLKSTLASPAEAPPEGLPSIHYETAPGSALVPESISEAAAPALAGGGAAGRWGVLYDLLVQCGAATRLDPLLQTVLERCIDALPGAARGALLLRGEDDALLLKAFRSSTGPVVSETLARRALREGVGFIWRRDESGAEDDEHTLVMQRLQTGMYAPLLWRGQALGVVCVDNPLAAAPFTQDDLHFLMAAAHYLALALSNQRLQAELRREAALKANLLRHFSPQVAEHLLTLGTLQLSGERSEVTILCSDIRGFSALSRDMEPIEVVELLNDYFSRLTPLIFAHGGTIDKYIGDGILAVFGSPHKDPHQHENALRTAAEMQSEMLRLNAARAARGKTTCNIGIGLHCGEVLHGFIGVVDHLDLTVIGEAVNTATRYCDGAQGGEVLMSPQVYQWVWKSVDAEPATITTKHGETLSAFRLLGLKETA